MRDEPVILHFVVSSGSEDLEPAAEEVFGAAICPVCFECLGELEVRPDPRDEEVPARRYSQRCRCDRRPEEERWFAYPDEVSGPRFDFNTYLELCHCCAAEPLKSGSRWSPFFCDDCKTRVRELDRGLGRWLIPIGRHTAMHGLLLPAAETVEPQQVERFATGMRGLFDAMGRLHDWRAELVGRNLAALGFPPGVDVDLVRYLAAVRRDLDTEAAFSQLRGHFVEET